MEQGNTSARDSNPSPSSSRSRNVTVGEKKETEQQPLKLRRPAPTSSHLPPSSVGIGAAPGTIKPGPSSDEFNPNFHMLRPFYLQRQHHNSSEFRSDFLHASPSSQRPTIAGRRPTHLRQAAALVSVPKTQQQKFKHYRFRSPPPTAPSISNLHLQFRPKAQQQLLNGYMY